MNNITETQATVIGLGQMVHTDRLYRPYVWGKILLDNTKETSWVIIYDFLVGKGSKVIVYPLAESDRYGIKHIIEHSDEMLQAIEMIVEHKVQEALAKRGI